MSFSGRFDSYTFLPNTKGCGDTYEHVFPQPSFLLSTNSVTDSLAQQGNFIFSDRPHGQENPVTMHPGDDRYIPQRKASSSSVTELFRGASATAHPGNVSVG